MGRIKILCPLGIVCAILFCLLRGALFNGTLPQIEEGIFQENAEHFWDKSQSRQAAQIIILTTFLGMAENQVCDSKIILYNKTENKIAIICEISSRAIKSDNLRGIVQIGVLIFGLDEKDPFLITIIPARWSYAKTLICVQNYIVIKNNNFFNLGKIPPPGIPTTGYCATAN